MKLFVTVAADCEATQPAIHDTALGESAVRGLIEICLTHAGPGTFFVIPTDIEASPALYKETRGAGWEVGLHVHPAAQGYEEFMGVYGAEDQRKILEEAMDRFKRVMGYQPRTICMGYTSANDHTYPVIEALGFSHGQISKPCRVLPECASVWAGAPLDIHYPHRYNRVLEGDVNFVEIPTTLDPDSMMWGGKHPQDLRVELVDAKNHWYTMDKAIRRQLTEERPFVYLTIKTHNTFDYACPTDFRRETLQIMLRHVRTLAAEHKLDLEFATLETLNRQYREIRPHESAVSQKLDLDRRGHGGEPAAG